MTPASKGGKECEGVEKEIDNCNTDPCPIGPTQKTQACNTHACPGMSQI